MERYLNDAYIPTAPDLTDRTSSLLASMSQEKVDLHDSKAESLRDLRTPEDDSSSLSSEETKALLRRIDLRLMPIMMACWTLQFIDKVVLNYANIMGLQKDTGLKGDQFAWLATGFFIAFSIFQLPGSE